MGTIDQIQSSPCIAVQAQPEHCNRSKKSFLCGQEKSVRINLNRRYELLDLPSKTLEANGEAKQTDQRAMSIREQRGRRQSRRRPDVGEQERLVQTRRHKRHQPFIAGRQTERSCGICPEAAPYLEDHLKGLSGQISHNLAENAIRPFARGRKNRLFSNNSQTKWYHFFLLILNAILKHTVAFTLRIRSRRSGLAAIRSKQSKSQDLTVLALASFQPQIHS